MERLPLHTFKFIKGRVTINQKVVDESVNRCYDILYKKGVTVKQRFASVDSYSKKQPNFGRSGCFFDVFYFFWSVGY